MLPMLDMWTDVFANPGKRTAGTAAQDFVVAGPRYGGGPPVNLPVISAPTPYVWIIGRTQTNGPSDYPNVHQVQHGYGITVPGQPPEHVVDAGYDTATEPVRLGDAMRALDRGWASSPDNRLNPAFSTPNNAPRSRRDGRQRCRI